MKANAAKRAIGAAYEADPTATSIYPYGLTNLECFTGPESSGNAKFDWGSQRDECATKVSNLYKVYALNGMIEFYDAALAAYNFAVNQPSPPRVGTKQAAVNAINDYLLSLWP